MSSILSASIRRHLPPGASPFPSVIPTAQAASSGAGLPPNPVTVTQEKAGSLVAGVVDKVVDNLVQLQSPPAEASKATAKALARDRDRDRDSGGSGGAAAAAEKAREQGPSIVDFPPPPIKYVLVKFNEFLPLLFRVRLQCI